MRLSDLFKGKKPKGYNDLGAQLQRDGCQFRVVSTSADQVMLCLFDAAGTEKQIPMEKESKAVWSAFVPGVKAGQQYGYRAHGPYDPSKGLFHSPSKLLLDPYAKEISADFSWKGKHFTYQEGTELLDGIPCMEDNAATMTKGIVIDPKQDTPCGRHPNIPWDQTVFYETHVKGFTRERLDLSEKERGTFDGLKAPQMLDYLKALGITAIELLPIHAFIHDHFLHKMGLTNYWGYNTLNYFAPHLAYLGQAGSNSIRDFVRAAHDKGLEVIIDVVYNHTAESSALGPTLSFRGLDNHLYYRVNKDAPHTYNDITGCGNTLNTGHPVVRQMILDSLTYYTESYGIDGFRFDLAPVLGNGKGPFNKKDPFFKAVTNSKALKNSKLIAEPWCAAPVDYSLGHFPKNWMEWNDQARIAYRCFWKNSGTTIGELAHRLSGSSDLYEHKARPPQASVNLVACHDGFTLADLTQYNNKYNFQNGEHNRDGDNHNLTDNFGVEGPSQDATIQKLRQRRRKSLIATALLSVGTPLILGGDEFGRTQMGSNNAYCQDNSINWLNWGLLDTPYGAGLHDFVAKALQLRQKLKMYAYTDHFAEPHEGVKHWIEWLNHDAKAIRDDQWQFVAHRHLVMLFKDEQQKEKGAVMIAINAGALDQDFILPPLPPHQHWSIQLDSGTSRLDSVDLSNSRKVHVKTGAMMVLTSGNCWR